MAAAESENREEQLQEGVADEAEEVIGEGKGKDKKSQKKGGKDKEAGENEGAAEVDGTVLSSQQQLMQIFKRNRVCKESRTNNDRPHPFWDTQPVPSMSSEKFQESDAGPIDPIKKPSDVKDEPYPLPDAFQWHDCDITDDAEVKEIYTLLTENYVEDDDAMFRFDYSVNFLRWALETPGYLKSWHLGVRVKTSQKLVGFLTATPACIQILDKKKKMAEINFLCVHKKLRSKRLAPVLIKEITRRVNKEDVWQAVYTAGVVLPRPVSECRYYHRSLNPKKLIDIGFSHLGPRMTMARTIKLYKVPETPQLPGMRLMEAKDVDRVFELVTHYLRKFALHPEFDRDEIAHWMMPREGVVYSYVRENPAGEVVDVVSFYSLPSSILGNEKYNLLKAAYSFWTVAVTVPLHELMYDALIFAKQNNFDVFNALDVMDNESALKELKFGPGDGFLQYYLYNWKCPKLEPSGTGLVLL